MIPEQAWLLNHGLMLVEPEAFPLWTKEGTNQIQVRWLLPLSLIQCQGKDNIHRNIISIYLALTFLEGNSTDMLKIYFIIEQYTLLHGGKMYFHAAGRSFSISNETNTEFRDSTGWVVSPPLNFLVPDQEKDFLTDVPPTSMLLLRSEEKRSFSKVSYLADKAASSSQGAQKEAGVLLLDGVLGTWSRDPDSGSAPSPFLIE